MGPIKFCLQDALPTVFTDDLSFIETISKIIDKMNEIIDQINILDPIDTSEIEKIARDAAIQVTNEHIATYVRVFATGGIAQTTTEQRVQFYNEGTRFFLEPNSENTWLMYTLQSTGAYYVIGGGGSGGSSVTSVNGQQGDVYVASLYGEGNLTHATYDGYADYLMLRNYEGATETLALVANKDGSVEAGPSAALVKQYSPVNPPPYPVSSVNGKTGAVTIDVPTPPVTSVNSKTGAVTITAQELGAYAPGNPPPYPVTSVNGQTGAVTVETGGAVSSVNGETGAVKTSSLYDNTSKNFPLQWEASDSNNSVDLYPNVAGKSYQINFKNSGQCIVNGVSQYSSVVPPPYPVSSVNGQSGTVNITANDLGAYSNANPPPYPVSSVNGATGAVNVTQLKESGTTNYLTPSFSSELGTWKLLPNEGIYLSWNNKGVIYAGANAQYSATNPPPYPVTHQKISSDQCKLYLNSDKNFCLCFGSEVGNFNGENMSYYFQVPNVTQIFWILAVTASEQCYQSQTYCYIGGSGNNVINVLFTAFESINPPSTASFKYLIVAN